MSSLEIRRALEDSRIAEFFDGAGTSVGFGPAVNPRVLRRVIRLSRAKEPAVLVTGRKNLAETIRRSRMGVVLTSSQDFGGVPEAVASLISGRVNP